MPRSTRQTGHRGTRLLIERSQIDFLVRHAGRPGFHPSGTFRVFVNSIAVGIMRGLELPCLSERPPVGEDELGVSTYFHVVFAGHQEQRVGIGRRIGIRQTPPIHQVGRLRPLMNNFAFGTLPFDQEIQLIPCQLEIAITIHRVKRP